MVLSVIEYCDIIYTGTTQSNITKIDNLFYTTSRKVLCNECTIAPLCNRRDTHLLLFMHKQTNQKHLLKEKTVNTRLHNVPVFKTFKPNNEKSKCLL